MGCPFPGMDPYIERPAIWPDFHDRFVGIVCGMLNGLVRPKYVAMTQERLYVVESERAIRPDVTVVRSPSKSSSGSTAIAVLEADLATVFEISREEIRESYIEIIEPAAGNRVVTAIEVLSPSNKEPGAGRTSYINKREELFASGASFVEIDLLHEGELTVRLSQERIEALDRFHYLVSVTRQWPTRQEVYAVPVPHRLPRVSIPLDANVADVTLDLQAAFTRCWSEGPYPELLRYDGVPPGKWEQAETDFIARTLIPPVNEQTP